MSQNGNNILLKKGVLVISVDVCIYTYRINK